MEEPAVSGFVEVFMQHKTEIATGASYTASMSGVAVGSWLGENWLGLLSAFFLVLTYLTQVFFTLRRERRDEKLRALEQELLRQRTGNDQVEYPR